MLVPGSQVASALAPRISETYYGSAEVVWPEIPCSRSRLRGKHMGLASAEQLALPYHFRGAPYSAPLALLPQVEHLFVSQLEISSNLINRPVPGPFIEGTTRITCAPQCIQIPGPST